MREAWEAMCDYARQNSGAYPPNLEVLVARGLKTQLLICPESRDLPATGPSTQQAIQSLSDPSHCSYIYVANGLDTSAGAEYVIMYERSGHKGGINILYGDGHVDMMKWSDAMWVLVELQTGHNPPRARVN